jgi:hypothetical protein
VTKKKSEYNFVVHSKHKLKSDIKLLKQKCLDLSLPEKSDLENEKKSKAF